MVRSLLSAGEAERFGRRYRVLPNFTWGNDLFFFFSFLLCRRGKKYHIADEGKQVRTWPHRDERGR